MNTQSIVYKVNNILHPWLNLYCNYQLSRLATLPHIHFNFISSVPLPVMFKKEIVRQRNYILSMFHLLVCFYDVEPVINTKHITQDKPLTFLGKRSLVFIKYINFLTTFTLDFFPTLETEFYQNTQYINPWNFYLEYYHICLQWQVNLKKLSKKCLNWPYTILLWKINSWNV